MEIKNKQHGFSLIEMITVIVVLLIVVTAASNVLVQQFQLFNQGKDLITSDWQGRISIEQMTRNIRNADKVITANSNSITFENEFGYQETYQLNGTQLFHSSNEPGSSPSAVADNIQQLSFSYYKGNGTTTTNTNKIRYILLNLNIKSRSSDFNLTTAIFLWNIKT